MIKQTTPDVLTNSDISELLASEAEGAKQPLQKALRRASRRAFLWPEEAAHLVSENRSLEEFPAVGPYLSKLIRRWIENPPAIPERPAIRKQFFPLPEAQAILATANVVARTQRRSADAHSVERRVSIHRADGRSGYGARL